MGRWLLENTSFAVLAVVFVVAPCLLAVVVGLVLRRVWPGVAEGKYHDTGTTLLTETLAVYGIVLAFVIVNQYGDANETSTDVQTEALNIEDLYRSSQAFVEPARTEMRDAVSRYVHSVVEDEWPLLSGGSGSTTAAKDFERLYSVLRTHQPTTPAEVAFYEQAVRVLHDAHDARHRRLDAAQDSLPDVLALFLVLGAVASVASTYLLGMSNNQLLVPAGLAALLGFTLLLSLTLEHPFSGPDGISAEHFRSGALAALFEPPRP